MQICVKVRNTYVLEYLGMYVCMYTARACFNHISTHRNSPSQTHDNGILDYIKKIANLPIEGLVSTDRSMVAALLNTTPQPVTKSSANDSTPCPFDLYGLYLGHSRMFLDY